MSVHQNMFSVFELKCKLEVLMRTGRAIQPKNSYHLILFSKRVQFCFNSKTAMINIKTIILFQILIALTMVASKPGVISAVSKEESSTNDATKLGINEEELKKDAYEKKLLHLTKMDLETLERKNSKKPCNERTPDYILRFLSYVLDNGYPKTRPDSRLFDQPEPDLNPKKFS